MNRNFIKIIVLIVSISTNATYGQTNDTTYIYGDSLNEKNIQIFKNWDYHPGDDSTWAQPNFSSAGWQLTDCRIRRIDDSVLSNNWSGIGWFRKTIVIDSSLMNKTVGMTLNHYGASEFYINGKLFNTFGKVSKDGKKEKIYYSNSKPLIIHFDSGSTYLLAIRFSNHVPIEHAYLYNGFKDAFGFFATLKSLNEALNFYGVQQANDTYLAAWFMGIFLSISVIYFLLFLFYSKQKEYLYYTIFTFSIALTFLDNVLDNIVSSNLLYFLGFTIIVRFIGLVIFLSVLAFLYQITQFCLPQSKNATQLGAS